MGYYSQSAVAKMIITVGLIFEFPTLKKLCVRNLISPPVKAETKRTKLEEFMKYHCAICDYNSTNLQKQP